MSGVTRAELIEAICEKCALRLRLEKGTVTEDEAAAECDGCVAAILAAEVADMAGIR